MNYCLNPLKTRQTSETNVDDQYRERCANYDNLSYLLTESRRKISRGKLSRQGKSRMSFEKRFRFAFLVSSFSAVISTEMKRIDQILITYFSLGNETSIEPTILNTFAAD